MILLLTGAGLQQIGFRTPGNSVPVAAAGLRRVVDLLHRPAPRGPGSDPGAALAEKWERLVEILAEDGEWTTAGAIAERLEVTPRTIRSYVTRANADGATLIASGPHGYRLDRTAWAARGAARSRDTSPVARTAALVRDLVDADQGLDVYEVAERLHVSEATVELDLRRIRSRLEG